MSATTFPAFVAPLIEELRRRFHAKHVEAELTGFGNRVRFAVVSDEFTAMPQLERQDRVWAVIDEVVAREDVLNISLVLLYAPGEIDLDGD